MKGIRWRDGLRTTGEVLWQAGDRKSFEQRYSPAECTGIRKRRVEGRPDPDHISRFNVERSNLTMHMGMRRFNWLTNAFSTKMENHLHMLSLYFVHYNFVRVHKSLRMTPAMVAGVTRTLHDMEWIVGLIDARAPKPDRPATVNALPILTHHAPPIVTRLFRFSLPGRLVFPVEVTGRACDGWRVGLWAASSG
ncbi:MAG: hypothetical protein OXQ89_02835 [Rhodospirillaceae bacterium]|nr:hypothetical protein [Rhodospirillaceae bacterium]